MKKRSYNTATTIAITTICLMIVFVCALILVVLFDFSGRKTPNVPTATTVEGINFTTTPITTPNGNGSTPTTSTNVVTTVPNTGTAGSQGTTQPPVTTPVVTTIPKAPTNEYAYEFKTDLSAYEEYMNPTGDKWDNAYLLLVNPDKPLAKDQELSFEFLKNPVKFDAGGIIKKYPTSQKTNAVALKALEAMAMEIAASGVKGKGNAFAILGVQSAYRTYATQKSIFEYNVNKTKKYVCDCGAVFIGKNETEDFVKSRKAHENSCGGTMNQVSITREEAVANVKTYSCMQGTSEHQSTLAFDLVDTTYPSQYVLEQIFAETDMAKWLEENCYKFGFILRFPKDKEDITGIIYEPWHFRFVGRYHATRMHELGMCLEEYTVYLTENGYFES